MFLNRNGLDQNSCFSVKTDKIILELFGVQWCFPVCEVMQPRIGLCYPHVSCVRRECVVCVHYAESEDSGQPAGPRSMTSSRLIGDRHSGSIGRASALWPGDGISLTRYWNCFFFFFSVRLLTIMGNLFTFREREVILGKLFCLPSVKGSTLKEKNLVRLGANSFFLE